LSGPALHPHKFEKSCPLRPHPYTSNPHPPRKLSQPAPVPNVLGLKPARGTQARNQGGIWGICPPKNFQNIA